MKKTLISIAAIAAIVTGCISANPDRSPGAPAFVPSPELTNNAATVRQFVPVAQTVLAATPAAPASPLLPSTTDTVLGILFAVSAWYAKRKSDQAAQSDAAYNSEFDARQLALDDAQKHKDAAATLAAAAVSGSNGQANIAQIMQLAARSKTTAIVAQHIEDAQSPI